MKVAALALIFLGLTATFTPAPAHADSVLYSNGPSTYTGGDFINNGESISDSFTLAQNATITGFTFVAWLSSGDKLRAVDWSISSSFYAVNPVTADVTNTFIETHSGGSDIYTETVSFVGQSFSAGTHYLTLQNALTAYGGTVNWDVNYGPSTAEYDYYGNYGGTYSNTFTIVGNNEASATPEPSGFLLLGTGLLGLSALILRRRMATLPIGGWRRSPLNEMN